MSLPWEAHTIDGGRPDHLRRLGTPNVAIDDGSHTGPGGPPGTSRLDPGRFPATAYLWDVFTAG